MYLCHLDTAAAAAAAEPQGTAITAEYASHHVLVEKRVFLLDAKPWLQAWGSIERLACLGASVGGDRLARGQAGLAQDQQVLTSAERILSRDCSRSNGDARA